VKETSSSQVERGKKRPQCLGRDQRELLRHVDQLVCKNRKNREDEWGARQLTNAINQRLREGENHGLIGPHLKKKKKEDSKKRER